MTNTLTRPSIAAGTYRIEPSRTTVTFTIREMFGLHDLTGTFTVRDGTSSSPTTRRVLGPGRHRPGELQDRQEPRDAHIRGSGASTWTATPRCASQRPRHHRRGGLEPRRHADRARRHAPVTLRLVDGGQTPGCRFIATTMDDRTSG